jgi:Short C-terminal domain
MLLVPRQLRRVGMTGNVPYYGGRLTPAHAYAISHPARPAPQAPRRDASATVDALDRLRAAGVLTEEEYARIRERVRT